MLTPIFCTILLIKLEGTIEHQHGSASNFSLKRLVFIKMSKCKEKGGHLKALMLFPKNVNTFIDKVRKLMGVRPMKP